MDMGLTTQSDMQLKVTERGFKFYEFKDKNGYVCSLQKSSSADEDCIWLGIDSLNPKKLVDNEGWVDASEDIPKDIQFTTRMHIDRNQAYDLMRHLECFVETGEILDISDDDLSYLALNWSMDRENIIRIAGGTDSKDKIIGDIELIYLHKTKGEDLDKSKLDILAIADFLYYLKRFEKILLEALTGHISKKKKKKKKKKGRKK